MKRTGPFVRVAFRARRLSKSRLLLGSLFALGLVPVAGFAGGLFDSDDLPIVLKTQGSFMPGGAVVTNPGTFDPIALTPDGQTIHGDHAYAQYQVPLNARRYPLVMWHGGGQFTKTWETTPDGRDGFQNIFLRQRYTTYLIDQPRRGNAGRATTNGTIAAVPGPGPTGEQGIFIRFRLGLWPNYFPNVQFSHDPEALNQWWRQQTPDTATTTNDQATDPVAAMFNQIGPAVLLTHSAGGVLGWITATKSSNVRGVYAYEPVTQVFPEGQVPPPIDSGPLGPITGTPIPLSSFLKLTKIPIEIIWGDNFPITGQPPSKYPDLEVWQGRYTMAQKFVDLVNKYGGHAHMTHLPDIGIKGNTHFAMSDLNNKQIAGLLGKWLHDNRLDGEQRGW
ncbi:conserved hypothetical protein [Methylocella silvestris BL2]|uniref:Uncharacterized protein n=1 Tax=Methylocella silvestris (strain DSM 15510 / CIP 108128 / LMG 27833 / NCIMB 13906 / BL2) TaxID=395965 RepID=B8ELV4_METSB|nr:alpha/beta fold hydrolase [Methylocella silvestris]ACK50735.1 conserved hypothetical protein [Methylocella silvestris BL2]